MRDGQSFGWVEVQSKMDSHLGGLRCRASLAENISKESVKVHVEIEHHLCKAPASL